MSFVKRTLFFLANEAKVLYFFSYRDIPNAFLPGFLYGALALKGYHDQQPIPADELRRSATYLFLWLASFILFANISAQILSDPEEDKANKPDRPLPSGMVTMFGAKVRWAIATTTFVTLAAMKPTLVPATVTWICVTGFLALAPLGQHWFGKTTIAIPICTWAELEGALKATGVPSNPQVDCWRNTAILWTSMVIQIQDLRDVEGDRKVGRKTLPIVFGDRASRYIIAFFCVPFALLTIYIGGVFQLAPYTAVIGHFILAYRVLQGMGRNDYRYDRITFNILEAGACAGAVIIAQASWQAGTIQAQ